MRSKGFTIAELLIAVAVLSFLVGMFTLAMKGYERYRAIQTTKQVVDAINTAVQKTFIDNAQQGQSCYSWNDGICSQITLTPVQVDETTIQFNVFDPQVLGLLQSVGCQVQGGIPNFSVRCYDGFGRPLRFQVVNGHSFGQNYVAPYLGNPFRLIITDSIGTNYVVDLTKLINYYSAQSKEKFYTLAQAIRKYIQTKRELELANVCDNPGTGTADPDGGLGSWDDALVPWIWEAVSADGVNPLTLCQGEEDPNTHCGCANFQNTNLWSNDGELCVLDTGNEMLRFLGNINLDTTYWTDAFGNPITVVPLADQSGNPIGCPPPRPQPNYPQVLLPKTRIGVRDANGNWVAFIDIVNE